MVGTALLGFGACGGGGRQHERHQEQAGSRTTQKSSSHAGHLLKYSLHALIGSRAEKLES